MFDRSPFRALVAALLLVGTLTTAVLVTTPVAAETVTNGEAETGGEEAADDAVYTTPAAPTVWTGDDVLNGLPESVRSGARAAPPTPPPEA